MKRGTANLSTAKGTGIRLRERAFGIGGGGPEEVDFGEPEGDFVNLEEVGDEGTIMSGDDADMIGSRSRGGGGETSDGVWTAWGFGVMDEVDA